MQVVGPESNDYWTRDLMLLEYIHVDVRIVNKAIAALENPSLPCARHLRYHVMRNDVRINPIQST